MKISEILNELGDSSAKLAVQEHDEDMMHITADNYGLEIYFTRGLSPRLEMEQVYVEFAVGGRYDKTGTGNAIAIFSTVKRAVEQYLPKFVLPSDNLISYGADRDEPSRVRLYDKMVPIFSQILGNEWKYNSAPPSGGSIKTYTWTRK